MYKIMVVTWHPSGNVHSLCIEFNSAGAAKEAVQKINKNTRAYINQHAYTLFE